VNLFGHADEYDCEHGREDDYEGQFVRVTLLNASQIISALYAFALVTET